MFSPIKNLITYIQKNAGANSLFSGNSTREVSAKMDTENIKIEKINADMQIKSEIPKDVDTVNNVTKEVISTENVAKNENNTCEQNKETCSDIKDTDSKSSILKTESRVGPENSCEYEVDEDDDIEEQIESSIMLKTPVKVPTTNSSEILEVKKASNVNRSIIISHDFNRNKTLTPIDDELEDFRHDPMEVLGRTSSPCSNQHIDDFCSVDSTEEVSNTDFKSLEDITTEYEADDNKRKHEQITNGSEQEIVEEKYVETEDEQHGNLHDVEDEEEPFLDLAHYKSRNVIVLDDVDLNTSTASVETNTTADDPLAIACEEQEAFAADKTAALEELNLLSNSQTSQDENTIENTDEDLRWLKTDLDNNQPSCSSSCHLKEQNSKALPEKEERNGEGSDSGLGSETSALHITAISITDSSQLNIDTATPTQTTIQTKTKDSEQILSSNVLRLAKSPPKEPPKPQRSNLKRRLNVSDDVVEGLDTLESASSFNERSSLNGSIQKKPKRSINFDTVQVYYFPRQQGFGCVPSAGGCTLGMGTRHIAFKTLSLAEHAAELRRAHRMQLQEIHPRGSSSEDSEESEEDYLSEGSGSDLDGESNGFLQPVSPKQRRALLKAAGLRKIDPSEKAECRNIRISREVCGCSCRNYCDPETCSCAQSGIKCQVDRDMFPCGCSRDACGNTIGRVEFNPTRVRTHYIHTLMRLEMENRQQQNPYSSAVVSSLQSTPSSYYQTHLQQSQSNYSSGYASPAYNTASEIHQQSATSSYYHTQNPSSSNSIYGQQTSLEMNHNNIANSTASQYGIDTLDTNMFGGPTTTNTAYGELMSVGSYHYENLQTQASAYNSYHSAPYLNANSCTISHSTSNTYSSCAVPSIPPFGAATTTEATGVYHSVSTLSSLETTTAPSCNVNGTTSLENDANTSFISLSTPLASSSRLSQINDLLQHNRNATTALVAISQNDDTTNNKLAIAVNLTHDNINNLPALNSSLCSSVNTPTIRDAHKSCIAYTEQETTLKSTQIVSSNEDYRNSEPIKLPETTSSLMENIEELPSVIKPGFVPQTSLSEESKEANIIAVSAPLETSTSEVATAGN